MFMEMNLFLKMVIRFQGGLVNELKLNGITTIKKADKYLLEVFVHILTKDL